MSKSFEFSSANQATLFEILGSDAPIDELAKVVQNVRDWRTFYKLRTKPKEARAALQNISKSAQQLLRALDSIPDDLRDVYLEHTTLASAIQCSNGDTEIDVNLVSLINSIQDGADNALGKSAVTESTRGRPPDTSQLILASAVSDVLREYGHKVTGYESGTFVAVLEICTPAAGYDLTEIRNIARKMK